MTPPTRETILSRPRLRDDGLIVFSDQDGVERVLLFEIALQALEGRQTLEIYERVGRSLPLTRFISLESLDDPDTQPGARLAFDWLLAHGERRGEALIWRHDFDLHQPAAGVLPAPWASTFSQSFIVLALLAWRRFHPDRVSHELLRAACHPFLDDDCGIVTSLSPDAVWFQEYPFPRPTFVLNAHLLSLIALCRAVGELTDDRLRRRMESGIAALVQTFDDFDRGCWTRYDLESQGHLTLRLETEEPERAILVRSARLLLHDGTIVSEGHAKEFHESASYHGPFQGSDWHLARDVEEPLLVLPPDLAQGTLLHFAALPISFDTLHKGLTLELITSGTAAVRAFVRDPRSETLSFLREPILQKADSTSPERATFAIDWQHIGPPLPFHYQLFHAQAARELARLTRLKPIHQIACRIEHQLLLVPQAFESVASQRVDATLLLREVISSLRRTLTAARAHATRAEADVAIERRLNADLLQRLVRQEARSALLSNQYVNASSQLSARTGLRGGAKEVLRSIKRKLVPAPIETPRMDFAPPWIPLAHPLAPKGASLRVLVLSHMFPHPDQPSSGPFVLEQVKALRDHAGVDARVVVGRPFWMTHRHPLKLLQAERVYRLFHRDSLRWYDLDSVPVCYLPFRIFGPWFTQGWSYRAAVLKALPWLHDGFDFDLVHAHTGYLDGSAAQALARRCNVPMVITEHTGPFTILMRNPIVRRWTLRSLASGDHIITVSQAQLRAVAEHLTPAARDRLVVLPNVVDTSRFIPPSRWTPDPRAPRILFVGYFVPIKQLPLLLDAFQILLQRVPGASLQLVGGGENREQEELLDAEIARRNLHHRVACRGHQDRDEIARTLRDDCDLLVLCSRSETFGCVIIEALACGKPVVATRCGGPEDIITDDALGMLCENNNPQALADALAEVISRLPSYATDAIRRHAESHYSYPAVAGRIASLYRELVPRLPVS